MTGHQPFISPERALAAVVREALGLAPTSPAVGGDMLGDLGGMPWYVRIDKVPGGRSDRLQGDFVIDLEVYHPNYLAGESLAFSIEAFLLGYPHVVVVDGQTVVIDSIQQNAGPAEIPWDDPNVTRFLATYVITIRR